MLVHFEGLQFPRAMNWSSQAGTLQGLFLLNANARLVWERWHAGTSIEEIVNTRTRASSTND